jgi:hypothetical protein
MIDYDAIRADDERRYQAFRMTLAPTTRAELDAAATLIGPQGRSLSIDQRNQVCGCTWDAHTVRHIVGAKDPSCWFERLLAQDAQGQTSICCYAAPADDAQWDEWQDRPIDEWGTRYLTSRAVLRLAAQYEVTEGHVVGPWFCEECVCLCGRQTARPLGGFCAMCRTENDRWTDPTQA